MLTPIHSCFPMFPPLSLSFLSCIQSFFSLPPISLKLNKLYVYFSLLINKWLKTTDS